MSNRALHYLLAVLFGLTFWSRLPLDPDLGWHLLGGSWTLSHAAVPRQDIINSFVTRWHDYHWLAQVILFQLYSWGGFEALRIFLGVMMATIFVLLVRLAEVSGGKSAATFFVLILWGVFFDRLAQARPQIMVLVLLLLAHIRLVQPAVRGELGYLFCLAVCAVNMHVYWIFFPFLWLVYRVWQAREGRAYQWGGFVLLAFAGLVSPYGVFQVSSSIADYLSNYLILLDYLQTPSVLRGKVGEFQSPLVNLDLFSGALLITLIAFSRGIKSDRVVQEKTYVVCAGLGTILSMLALKYVALLMVLALPFLVRNVRLPTISLPYHRIVLVGVIVLFAVQAVRTIPSRSDDYAALNPFVPFEACRKIASAVDPARAVRIATAFDQGGWCRWIVYERDPKLNVRVTTDNRTQRVPAEQFEKGFDLYVGQRDWWQTLKEWHPDFILVKPSLPLANLLRLMPQLWIPWYEDEYFAIFSETSGSHLVVGDD